MSTDRADLRAQAMGLVAAWIRSNLEVGVVDDLDHLTVPEKDALDAMLTQWAEQLDALAAIKPRRARAKKPAA